MPKTGSTFHWSQQFLDAACPGDVACVRGKVDGGTRERKKWHGDCSHGVEWPAILTGTGTGTKAKTRNTTRTGTRTKVWDQVQERDQDQERDND